MLLNNNGKFGKYIIQNLQDPCLGSAAFQAMYRKFAKRVLWMDSHTVEGAFQMNTAWYFAVPDADPVFEEHVHDYDELIGFFGSDSNDPYALGAELEVAIHGEMHRLDRTSMLFIPAGMKHMPLSIKKVDRPIFHFSIAMNAEYSGEGAYK